jgi:hypothetical protein
MGLPDQIPEHSLLAGSESRLSILW